MPERTCWSWEELLGAFKSGWTGLSVENFYGRLLAELPRKEAVRSFAKRI